MRFTISDDWQGTDRDVVTITNDALDRVGSIIWDAPEIELPPSPSSAFAFDILRQVFAHRTLELGESVVRECVEGRWTMMAAAARSLIETTALLQRTVKKLVTALDNRDRQDFRKHVDHVFFATRDKSNIESGLGREAVNILTSIDAMDRSHPGIRRVYDRASEIAHPNASGMLFLYTKADYEKKTMRLGPTATSRKEVFGFVPYAIFTVNQSVDALEVMNGRRDEIAALDDIGA